MTRWNKQLLVEAPIQLRSSTTNCLTALLGTSPAVKSITLRLGKEEEL